jgi:hypothetical protein
MLMIKEGVHMDISELKLRREEGGDTFNLVP